jgi:hypothetical protein
VSIVASEDRTLTPDWCRRAARRAGHREIAEIGTGHCPHNSRPAALAALLAGLAIRHAAARPGKKG